MDSITLRFTQGSSRPVTEPDAEFTAFFRHEYQALVGTLFLVVHDREQACDIVQDALVELSARWSRISRYERPDAWVKIHTGVGGPSHLLWNRVLASGTTAETPPPSETATTIASTPAAASSIQIGSSGWAT